MFIALIICSNSIYSQANLSGNVSDVDGPLIGATIKIVGTLTGTTTDLDGNFSMDIEPGAYVLEATYTGYAALQQTVTIVPGQNAVDFAMSEGVLLGDIVVTGTRSNPRSTLSSPVPIDNFTAKVLDQQGNGDLTENLKNIVPSFSATPLTGDGAAFVRPTSLRGLPPDETLVLVN